MDDNRWWAVGLTTFTLLLSVVSCARINTLESNLSAARADGLNALSGVSAQRSRVDDLESSVEEIEGRLDQ